MIIIVRLLIFIFPHLVFYKLIQIIPKIAKIVDGAIMPEILQKLEYSGSSLQYPSKKLSFSHQVKPTRTGIACLG